MEEETKGFFIVRLAFYKVASMHSDYVILGKKKLVFKAFSHLLFIYVLFIFVRDKE